MAGYSSSSSSDPDDVIYRRMFLDTEACTDDAETVDDSSPRVQGGAGQGRPHRKRPRKFDEAGSTPMQQRRRNHAESPWAVRFFREPLTPGSLAWDAFRAKLRVPYPMFQWILSEARASGKFPAETVIKKGCVAAPLALQIVAALRYWRRAAA